MIRQVGSAPVGTGRSSTDYRGAEGIREYIAKLSDTFEWLDVRPVALTGAGDCWVTTNSFRARGRGSGVEVEQTFYQAIRLRGERARWWGFYESLDAALAAFGPNNAPREAGVSSQQ